VQVRAILDKDGRGGRECGMSASRTVEESSPLLAYLFAAWPEVKKKTAREWLKFRLVTVNGAIVTQFDRALKPGDVVAIRSKAFAAPETKLPGGILIRHEDAAIIVIEKPADLLSIASPSEDEQTAYAHLTDHVRRGDSRRRDRVWIVHRLDRETSGLMVFARTEAVQQKVQAGWDAVEKKYRAVVEGAPPQNAGVLESHLDESDRFKVWSTHEGPNTRRAVTRYRVEKGGKDSTLVELTLETGRRHQIRVQLADAGCPIVGDKKYGAQTNPVKRVALHASSLRFPHPVTGEAMRFISPLPGEFGRIV
jgi:23S rRNA pseudouridine1911/1915/1917 synthase